MLIPPDQLRACGAHDMSRAEPIGPPAYLTEGTAMSKAAMTVATAMPIGPNGRPATTASHNAIGPSLGSRNIVAISGLHAATTAATVTPMAVLNQKRLLIRLGF